ncbi:MAG TPA: tetratricopeptide repeat protein [Polyangiaceae bacterium]|nr:tetratricopeptide repeat protein [Polyangiaceae bacterium]
MRRRTGTRAAHAVFLGVLALSGAASADFDPRGRGHGRKPHPSAPASRPNAGPSVPAPARPAPSAEKSPGEGSEKSDALIARYMGLVIARPGEPFPLERLVELYRERDGNADELVQDLSKRAEKSGPEHLAALVALAGVLRADGKLDVAIGAYERAMKEAPSDPVPVLALGRLLVERGDKEGARRRFEQALPNVRADADREQLLRTLVGLALDLSDFDAAKRYQEELVKRAKGSFFARAELGRELLTRGDYARAEAEYREVVKAAAGDNRALSPALRDLGKALEKEGKHEEAIEVLNRALATAGGQSGLRREILDVLVDVHRGTGGVAALVGLLEKERPDDFERLSLLASLYEETGRVAEALTTYERALARKDDIATRLRVVQLLEVAGRLDDAVKQYGKLVAAAPHDPEIVFRLAQTLIERGDRPEALAAVAKLEARSAGDEEILTALVDFYEKIGESERAEKILDRLASAGGTDPRHLVELGDHYYQKGDTKRALEIWERIRSVVPDRAKGLHALGEVLLEHDMPDAALQALRHAVELAPKEVRYQKALALALERTGTNATDAHRKDQYEAARKIWESILEKAGTDRAAAREARQHIVTLWGLGGHLKDRARPLERRLAASPPDVEAGRLLAEVYARLRQPADAERVLRIVVSRELGDEEAYLGLERALVSQRKLAEAITVLEKLVAIDTRRAREYYQRMAGYAAELYRDDDAIRYASKAVDLNPDDAAGHQKLGEMYRRRQDVPHAIAELRRALAKNDRLFPVYFDLAELLLTRGEVSEADLLLRRVMRAATDDDLVARATRLAMQVNLGRGTLESLERELLPVALGNPMRPIYRRLLVEIYDSLAFSLVHEASGADPERRAAARESLKRIGERAVKPLLDALGDDRLAQQRTAVELLSRIQNASAAPALVAFATGKAEADLRTRAMIAVAALSDPGILPRLRSVIAPSGDVRVDETDSVAIAAAWGVARMRNPKARPLLLEMLRSDAPSVRALAAVGLGLLGNRADAEKLSAIAASPDHEPVVRAAAAFAVGTVAGGSASAEATLEGLVDAPDPLLRATAVLGLARLHGAGGKRVIASALVGTDGALRDAAADAALVLTTKEYRMPEEPLPVPAGRVDVRDVLRGLDPTGYTPDERARAVVLLEHELGDAAATAVHTGTEGSRVVADALLAGGTEKSFSPLTDGMEHASQESLAQARATIERIEETLVPAFLALTHHPSADVRARAIRVLARRSEPDAKHAVEAALDDTNPLVQRAALSLLSAAQDQDAVSAVERLATRSPLWPVRERAAVALGTLATGPFGEKAVSVLGGMAERDPIAFVREAALRALALSRASSARGVLGAAATRDAEPRLRALARTLLEETR